MQKLVVSPPPVVLVATTIILLASLLLVIPFQQVNCELPSSNDKFWNQPIQSRAIIEQVNSQPGVGWKAANYPQFENMKLSEFRKLLGVKNVTEPVPQPQIRSTNSRFNVRAELSRVRNLPESFDARKEWPNCIHPIRNQQQCGSCWAFSASAVLSDRFCVYSNGSVNVVLSPEYMVECSAQNHACEGGTLHAAWQFLVSVGIPTDACVPYSSGNGTVGRCPGKCTAPNQTSKFYKAAAAKKLEGMPEIMTEIKTHGSVQVAMAVFRDFFSYKSGVYHHVSGDFVGGHAIRAVGWGVDSASGLPYWICANSWGESWGIDGYFWILRGHNECGFGKDVWAGKPLL